MNSRHERFYKEKIEDLAWRVCELEFANMIANGFSSAEECEEFERKKAQYELIKTNRAFVQSLRDKELKLLQEL